MDSALVKDFGSGVRSKIAHKKADCLLIIPNVQIAILDT